VFGAAIMWLVIGVTLGMTSALKRGTVFDRVAISISLIGASLQVYFFGLVLLLVFVYSTGLLPAPSYTPFTQNPAQWALGLILPWVTLGFLNSALYARLSRAQMLETLSEDYVRTARAKGLTKRKVYTRHALRAAITPIITIAGLDIGAALGGTVITESIFGLQGLGRYSVQAVADLNLPIVLATVLLAATFIVVANIIVDLLYAVVDPRVRLS
jgi:peptide/nickel transport system permease protein